VVEIVNLKNLVIEVLIGVSVVVGFIFVQAAHPIILVLLVISGVVIIFTLIGGLLTSFLLGYIVLLTFLGGLLVLFVYVASLSPNEPLFLWKFSLGVLFTVFVLLGGDWVRNSDIYY